MRLLKATLAFIFLLPLVACATNHEIADLDARIASADKFSGLFVRLESNGLEMADEGPLVPIVMMNMTHMLSPQQLEHIVPALTFFLPADLSELGYEAHEARTEVNVFQDVLKSAIAQPSAVVTGGGLAALQSFAQRSGGRLVFLADVVTTHHISGKSRSFVANSKWAMIDPLTGEILRAFEDSLRE